VRTDTGREQLRYLYDAAGNLQYRTNNALVQNFQVNSLNELTTNTNGGTLTVMGTTTPIATNVTVNGSNATLYGDYTFAATNMSLTNTNFTALALGNGSAATNTVTVNLAANANIQYDGNGNLTNDGWRNFVYDDDNQLVQVSVSNQWLSRFVYDGKMRRRIRTEFTWQSSAWAQTNQVRYVYDGNLVIQERDTNDQVLATYTRGNDLSGSLQGAGGIGGLLARTDTNGSTFYHADGNGNITLLINSNQVIVAKYFYDAFGNVLSKSGLLADANLYRFSSKEAHPNSGMIYYLYRYYDPNLQRWPNRDPLGEKGGINLYEFVGNNPVGNYDFLGLSDCSCCTKAKIKEGLKQLTTRFRDAKKYLATAPHVLHGDANADPPGGGFASCYASNSRILLFMAPMPPCWTCYMDNAFGFVGWDENFIHCRSVDGSNIAFDWFMSAVEHQGSGIYDYDYYFAFLGGHYGPSGANAIAADCSHQFSWVKNYHVFDDMFK
jgi:RHS repeat-associated protein